MVLKMIKKVELSQKGRVGYRPKSKSQKYTEFLIPKMYIFDDF